MKKKNNKVAHYFDPLEKVFVENSNSVYASDMKRYMKDISSFYGIKSGLRNQLKREFLNQTELLPYDSLDELVKICWIKDQREWQYIGMELPMKYKKEWEPDIIELFEKMIVTKSWWDTVDYIASNLVGTWALQNENVTAITNRWNSSKNMWLIRTSILFQLKFKEKVDTDLLFKYINNHKTSREFFIKKAIGWALRQLSKTDPEIVRSFLNRTQLQPLIVREASKYI